MMPRLLIRLLVHGQNIVYNLMGPGGELLTVLHEPSPLNGEGAKAISTDYTWPSLNPS